MTDRERSRAGCADGPRTGWSRWSGWPAGFMPRELGSMKGVLRGAERQALGSTRQVASAGVHGEVLVDPLHGAVFDGQRVVVDPGDAGVVRQLVEQCLPAEGGVLAAAEQVHLEVARQRQGPQPRVLVADVDGQVLGGVAGL